MIFGFGDMISAGINKGGFMARQIKQGIDYYPMDVNFLNDIKVRKVLRGCGAQSMAVILYLLGNIYKDEGYYMRWDDEEDPFLVSDVVGVSEGAVRETIKKSLQVEFFDSKIFEKESILTSKGIQQRFMEATVRRINVNIKAAYWLLDKTGANMVVEKINVYRNSINVDNNSKNVDDNQQSKVKESKVNININTNNNNSLYKGQSADNFTVCVDNFTKNDELKKQLTSFARLRASKKKSFTAETFRLFLEQLKSLSGNNENTMIEILRASIMNGWINIYPLASKGGSVPKSRMNEYYLSDKRQTDDYTEEELKELLGIKGI